MLRFHLPPNFAAAVARDAVPLRVELDLSSPPPVELLPALALLQRWSGPGTPPRLIQLSRAQLRDLGVASGTQPLFVENGRTCTWQHQALVTEPSGQPSAGPGTHPTPHSRPDEAGAPLTVDGSEHFLALTLPSREHPRYADALALVKESGFILEPSNRKWWMRDRHKSLNFLASHSGRLRHALGAQFTPNFEKNTAHVHTAEIATTVAPVENEFSVTLALTAGNANDATVRSAVAANRGYLEADGKIFLLEASTLDKLAVAQRRLAGDPAAGLAPRRSQRISAAHAAEAQDVIEALSPGFQPPESWKLRSAALRNLTALAPAPVADALNVQLRPYQRLGTAWLWHLCRHELGGILADEMGLGKTLQALGLVTALNRGRKDARPALKSPLVRSPTTGRPIAAAPSGVDSPQPGVTLVVAPASLLENWRRESARFAPELRVFVHHGEQRLAAASAAAAHDLVITSYGTLARDQELFAGVEFACIIADEAQHIKNRRSQNAAALRALRARARFLLTGTPLENSLEDLRSLFEFILPGYLTKLPGGIRGDERSWFDERLRAQTAPYILRRTKKAVAPELPEKLEHVIWCELAPAQAKLYRDTQESLERELFDLEAGGANEGALKFAALTQLLRLRQICCDPRLLPSNRDRSTADALRSIADADPSISGAQSSPASQRAGFPDSAKLNAFNELLAEAVDDGHRVLVFSQFTSLLALLRVELDAQQIHYSYLDGSMPTRARQAAVDRFQSSPDIPLFLLSLKAGGTGLNLTGADTVVHYDPWWNPAAEAQATDRAHRIGQSRVVTSYKLIAAGTVEEKVLALQAEKRALLAGVFEASDAAAAKLSLAELKSLLQ